MKEYIECAGIKKSSVDDGPGVRTVLYFQGCSRKCHGCQNKDIQERGKGVILTIDEIILCIQKECFNHKVTISGGEPLEQITMLEVLLLRLKSQGYNICLYTGYDFLEVPQSILELVDYIKVGRYIESQKNDKLHYFGSYNQKLMKKNYVGKWECTL